MRYLLSDKQLDRLLEGLTLVPLDCETSVIFGLKRACLRRSGNIIAELDILIASSALRHNVTLLTNNRRDFERIEGLMIESA